MRTGRRSGTLRARSSGKWGRSGTVAAGPAGGGVDATGTVARAFRARPTPGWKTGKFSSYLPPRLRGTAERAYRDSELGSMRREMAVLEAHMRSLEAQLDEGVPGSRGKDLTKASAALDAARAAGDGKAAAKAIKQMR